MKIVHFIPFLGKGGAERVVCDLANAAVDEGHEVTIIAARLAPPELLSHCLKPAVDLRHMGSEGGSHAGSYVRIFPWVLRNRRWLLSRDIVHCHLTLGSVFAAAVQMVRRLSGSRTPAILETYHAVGVAIPRFKRAVHSQMLKRRDAVAFMAEDAYWTRYREARPKRLFRTIPNGVSAPPAIDPVASERYRREVARIPDNAFVVGSVGRLAQERRPDLLLQAFIQLAKRSDRDVHLLLAGEGPERARLEAEVRRNGLQDRVHMPGLIRNPVDAFGMINLYLTVNIGPLTGIAALEAAFSGTPIIALQLDRSYRPGPNDWIWSSSEPTEIAEQADELLDSPGELKRLGESQRRYARDRHSVEAMARAYYKLYHDVLAERLGDCH